MDVETEILWFNYNNFPHQYLAGTDIQDIRDDIDAILDAPPAEGITVLLNPGLVGARLEFRYRSYGMDQYIYHRFSDVTGMTNWPQGAFTNYDLFSVLFPAQTINGVSYLEASTPTFSYSTGDQTFTLNLLADVVPTLTINVDKTSGYIGETFTFTGVLSENGTPLAGEIVNLFDQQGMVGTGVTDVNGAYSIEWTPWLIGSYSLYAEAL